MGLRGKRTSTGQTWKTRRLEEVWDAGSAPRPKVTRIIGEKVHSKKEESCVFPHSSTLPEASHCIWTQLCLSFTSTNTWKQWVYLTCAILILQCDTSWWKHGFWASLQHVHLRRHRRRLTCSVSTRSSDPIILSHQCIVCAGWQTFITRSHLSDKDISKRDVPICTNWWMMQKLPPVIRNRWRNTTLIVINWMFRIKERKKNKNVPAVISLPGTDFSLTNRKYFGFSSP